MGQNLWDDRQAEQTRQELRDLGFNDEAIEELEEAAEDANDLDPNDGSLSSDEIGLIRIAVEGISESDSTDGLTDEEIRTFADNVCRLAADAEDQNAFVVALGSNLSENETGLSVDAAFLLAAFVADSACRAEAERISEQSPMTVGSDPRLDALHDGCVAGSLADCDVLFIGSPIGSEYEAVGLTCGGRNEPLDGVLCMFHHDDFSDLAGIEGQCEAGSFAACDLLFIASPIGSAAEEVGATCGGRREASFTLGCIDQPGLSSEPTPSEASVSSGPGAVASVFEYPDFTSVDGITLVGSAQRSSPALLLTTLADVSVTDDAQAGAAWYDEKLPVENGFETTFAFQLEMYSWFTVGEGFAFVIQNSGPAALGEPSFGMGYGGIANSVAVEFDTVRQSYLQDPRASVAGAPDLFSNHVSVQTRGTEPNGTHADQSIGSADLGDLVMANRAAHRARISYVPGELSVFVDDFDQPVLTVDIDLAEILRLDGGSAYVGFTAATEPNFFAAHKLLAWRW